LRKSRVSSCITSRRFSIIGAANWLYSSGSVARVITTDPELYNQFAAPMMENLREVMQEETRDFLNELARHDRVVRVTRQLVEKITRLFLHHLAQIFHHRRGELAPTPESQVLITKAVSIARPVNAKVSFITLATDPEPATSRCE
jgi:hypothetical protein